MCSLRRKDSHTWNKQGKHKDQTASGEQATNPSSSNDFEASRNQAGVPAPSNNPGPLRWIAVCHGLSILEWFGSAVMVKMDVLNGGSCGVKTLLERSTAPDRIMEKKTFQFTGAACLWKKSYEPFFSHNYCFQIFFPIILSVTGMSIDSQFECILRGNIEL